MHQQSNDTLAIICQKCKKRFRRMMSRYCEYCQQEIKEEQKQPPSYQDRLDDKDCEE